ncbi:hypothetical protein TanjilG_30364 [Lupinus angustifolius]|nr:hypothetical protein TanjilG_30364 [Lupinus angustifolius]
MGRGSKYGERSKSAFSIDNENSDIITHHMKPKTFSHYVRELDQKKASVRVDALSSIIKILNEGKERDRLEKDNAVETQEAMQLIWKFISPESNLDVPVRNHVPVIMPSAVSAWLFLFTKIEGWELSYQWKGAISIFLNMIESDDDSLCDPAAEALAMIYNSDQINKFLKVKPALSYSEIKNHIKDFILRRLENVSKAKNEISLTHVLNYFNDGISPQSLKNIDGNNLNLSSWSSMIQRQSIIDKSKTKVLNKRRTFAEERKGLIYQVESEF